MGVANLIYSAGYGLNVIMAYVIMTPLYEQIILCIIYRWVCCLITSLEIILYQYSFKLVTNHRPTFYSTYTFTKRLALRLINVEKDACFQWMKQNYFASLFTGFGRASIMVMYLLGISVPYRRLFMTVNEQTDLKEREKNGLVKYFNIYIYLLCARACVCLCVHMRLPVCVCVII